MAKATGWIPQQHGAWAMIFVPYSVGAVQAVHVRPFTWADVTLGLTWLVGYFAYNAAVLVLKSPAKQRPRYYPPPATYAGAATAFGLATLGLRGWEILWWAPAYGLLVGSALWLAAHKRERSVLSGVLTVIASCGLMAVLRLTPGVPMPTPAEWATMVGVTAYFVGTILHVKALIRERRDPASARRSLAYHVVFLVAAVVAAVLGWLTWWWPAFWAVLVARSIWMPRVQRTAKQIGLTEMVLSICLVAIAIAA